MALVTTIEYIEEFNNEIEAIDALSFLSIQLDYLGGRIIPPIPNRPTFKLQAFFENTPNEGLLPIGMNRRLTPTSLLNAAR